MAESLTALRASLQSLGACLRSTVSIINEVFRVEVVDVHGARMFRVPNGPRRWS